MPTAIRILFDGMIVACSPARSSPTVSPVNDDPVGALKIVNGNDKAKLIAGYYRNFLDAHEASRAPAEAVPDLVESLSGI